jgi:hypothetical protein
VAVAEEVVVAVPALVSAPVAEVVVVAEEVAVVAPASVNMLAARGESGRDHFFID